MRHERLFLCAGASRPAGAKYPAGVQEVPLLLWGDSRNIEIKMSDITERMGANLTDLYADLLEIATYVYCADQTTPRGGSGSRYLGEGWRRNMNFIIPVRKPGFWSQLKVRDALVETLGFLSDDSYDFCFTKLQKRPSVDNYFEFSSEDITFDAEDVLLFSGGLDSLGGVVKEVFLDNKPVVLVSHRSAPKIAPKQVDLHADVCNRCADSPAPKHIPVWIQKHGWEAVDNSQRTRSFLYASLAAIVARMFDRDRIRFYENGVTSLNLPIAEQILGARATRTTHPRSIAGFHKLLSLVSDGSFQVETPFLWKTKTDVLELIKDAGFSDLMKYAVSCSHVWEMTKLHTHCGCCSQCIDRRLAIGAGGGDYYYSYYKKIKAITIIKGQTTRLEILLDRNPSVSGVVLDEYGQPVAGALVKGHWDGDEVLTTKNGKFEVGLHSQTPCERLFVRSVERNLSAIAELKEPSGSIIVTLKPALSITGQVTDTDSVGIPAARVSLWPCGPEVLTDAQGRYQMRAILPEQTGGDYLISVNASGYGVTERKRIAIMGAPGAPVEMKSIALQRADQSISGVVVDAEGKPAARVPIILHGRGQPQKCTTTDGNGRFSIDRVCKGPLSLQVGIGPWQTPGSVAVRGGDSNVKAIIGQHRIHTEYVSLIGKLLPGLDSVKIDLVADQAKDKMMLVCFLDINQRPSRNMIGELAKRGKELEENGVVVLLVHTSDVDAGKLKEWIKKNNILFPVGMIEGDEEKIRFAWGVRSLPWLILTDKGHVVTAEGFGFDELKDRLGDMDNVRQ